ncbi:uncharacterized protein VDAG_04043 [Verticillium dahliae VdLs.17]|uniref:Uncharacterized protein n=1 Tax=Verticillium dahliae (strain VdLs.17 / ATCC MYA-4575 / FGSC 10137) TaxID=498257 RepID=G2X1B4_VERDV|nr:uncharacterized protein VDAG_04043 [Verticillium dahliae VdLs.17]EGY22605.1 hypothetical protein VDAG_04043 [Verticillium dahliae VdLs.17]
MARLSVPTTGPLSSAVRIHKSNAIVQKIVGRLSRPALLSLALDWLDEDNQLLCAPQLGGSHDPNDFYPPAESLQQLRRLYLELQARKGSKKDVVDRIATGADSKVFRNLVEEGIPKALSQPRKRYTLQATNVRSKNLSLLLSSKGAGRTNAAAGGWSFYADRKKNESPLDTTLPTPPLSEDSESVSSAAAEQVTAAKRKVTYDPAEADRLDKKARLLAARARFGDSAKLDDGRGIERVDITMEDSFLGPENNVPVDEDEASWAPGVKLTFRGSHVFAGMRQLVEAGVINGSRMPGWLTGEEGVTIGVVRDGRIRGYKGSGI